MLLFCAAFLESCKKKNVWKLVQDTIFFLTCTRQNTIRNKIVFSLAFRQVIRSSKKNISVAHIVVFRCRKSLQTQWDTTIIFYFWFNQRTSMCWAHIGAHPKTTHIEHNNYHFILFFLDNKQNVWWKVI